MKNLKNDIDWEPLSDEFFEDSRLLTLKDLVLIEENLDWSHRVISKCGPNDQDVVMYHNKYIDRIFTKLANNFKTIMIMKGRRI